MKARLRTREIHENDYNSIILTPENDAERTYLTLLTDNRIDFGIREGDVLALSESEEKDADRGMEAGEFQLGAMLKPEETEDSAPTTCQETRGAEQGQVTSVEQCTLCHSRDALMALSLGVELVAGEQKQIFKQHFRLCRLCVKGAEDIFEGKHGERCLLDVVIEKLRRVARGGPLRKLFVRAKE